VAGRIFSEGIDAKDEYHGKNQMTASEGHRVDDSEGAVIELEKRHQCCNAEDNLAIDPG
jgi:hypothetical protein